MSNQIQVITDTATLCIYDLQALKHRLEDTSDWWSIPEDELLEVNLGNVAFLNVGADGLYTMQQVEDIQQTSVQLWINVPSGQLYAGAAENVTGGELEPEDGDSGQYITVEPGVYHLKIARNEQQIEFALLWTEHQQATNEFKDLIRIG
ncbi:hypothetical protein PaeCFBP13512_08610 [Paenibacillus sp. CFBP13512]|uniref:DUF6386 family protein n=1 Tax=Paenibacillus sp. CFBP13512 TaxID=2184007 RepID=UPI0010C09377|nr:DUF6386 family protein [Paenibacillus sp. CFBP13512]TKJ92337.1 hypothetical protein PaeCFBP13512_08610 [Paenibacillus sp. CFBP13512]